MSCKRGGKIRLAGLVWAQQLFAHSSSLFLSPLPIYIYIFHPECLTCPKTDNRCLWDEGKGGGSAVRLYEIIVVDEDWGHSWLLILLAARNVQA